MKNPFIAPVLISACLVSACIGTEPRGGKSEKHDDDVGIPYCKAEDYEYLIGQPVSKLEEVDLPNVTRVLRPGDVVTLDYSEDRLNVETDKSGRIIKMKCG